MSNAAAGLPYVRHPIEIESPEERGYGNLRCNLTESSYTDGTLEEFGVDLRGLVLCYGDHLGHPGLRELIASSADGFGAEHLSPEDVILTPGAAAALFFVNSSLLGPGRHIVVEHNNYATNLTTPERVASRAARHEPRAKAPRSTPLDRNVKLQSRYTFKLIRYWLPPKHS